MATFTRTDGALYSTVFDENGNPVYYIQQPGGTPQEVGRNAFIAQGGTPQLLPSERHPNVLTGIAPTDDPLAAAIDETAAYVPKTDEQLAALAAKNAAENAAGQSIIDYNTNMAAYRAAVDNIDNENDWRVRLHLAPFADYLYKAASAGILAPLKETDGIIFPYTPQIQVQYSADYENYDLVHSNYRGYFYKGSKTENIIVTATFTANDVREANYLLASLHFLKSVTKMFYGQDQNRGMPPPVCFLTGLGEFQFNNHPCALTSMHYNLPNDVDYIPCGRPEGIATPEPPKAPAGATASARLSGNGQVGVGGKPPRLGKEKDALVNGYPSPYTKATYVPTKIDINFTMIPVQTRDQISKGFSLRDYANGSLLKKGFW